MYLLTCSNITKSTYSSSIDHRSNLICTKKTPTLSLATAAQSTRPYFAINESDSQQIMFDIFVLSLTSHQGQTEWIFHHIENMDNGSLLRSQHFREISHSRIQHRNWQIMLFTSPLQNGWLV